VKTLDEVRTLLSDIEPTEATYAALDRDDIPHLVTLLNDQEAWMAARAVHALSRQDDTTAREALVQASRDVRTPVRIAVATAVPLLPTKLGSTLLDHLLDDEDVGVRKFALRSVPVEVASPVRTKIQRISKEDAYPEIRVLAETVHARLP